MSMPFYFSDSESSASSTDLSSLPYPKPLTRASFLTPDFDPAKFLSSLHNRHQTLEDLRAELRQRSQDLNQELLDLVNSNYEDFLGLGNNLRGGNEKVEEVKLGILGFQREVEGLRDSIKTHREKVAALIERRRQIREQIALGRGMLEVERHVGQLERRLKVKQHLGGNVSRVENGNRFHEEYENGELGGAYGDDDEFYDDDEESSGLSNVEKLQNHVDALLLINKSIQGLGPQHLFLKELDERVINLKQTVLLDLQNALKESSRSNDSGKASVMQILRLYDKLDAPKEAMSVLKDIRGRKG